MTRLGIEERIVDEAARARTIARFREAGIVLPTFAELADPWLTSGAPGRLTAPSAPGPGRIPPATLAALAAVDPDAAHPLNLFRVHWHNAADRRARVTTPQYVELPSSLTGVRARILVALGDRFPMIATHKVLAAYACLVPRLVTGQFDPTAHRALWPSTGNYCRGGVAISRILGCRGVAILPAGMSEERFRWLSRWVVDPEADIVRTPGSESNVKEIYDASEELERDPRNVVFNQFCEFGNHLVHRRVTAEALARVFEAARERSPGLRLAAFTSATGSAGTIGAGDTLKDRYGAKTVAVEALECPTLLYNGFGAHNIQGIGDKHVPLIHNVMNTDVVTAVSDAATDSLGLLFAHPAGLAFLRERRGVPAPVLDALSSFGFSAICNVLAAIKVARYHGLGEGDAIVTVATDGAAMYRSELDRILAERFGGRFDEVSAAEVFGQYMLGAGTDHLLELRHEDRTRIFNLGYFTWVEQRGIPLAEFEARRDQGFWRGLERLLGVWDELIRELNARVAAGG